MSYTPHTWVIKESITAAKLNNIEDGVQEAAQSGGGSAWITLSASGFPTQTNIYGYVVYAKYDSNSSTWVLVNDEDLNNGFRFLHGFATNIPGIIDPSLTILPKDNGIRLYFVKGNESYIVTSSGDIGEAETIYYSYGSVVVGNYCAYNIAGDGSIGIEAQ